MEEEPASPNPDSEDAPKRVPELPTPPDGGGAAEVGLVPAPRGVRGLRGVVAEAGSVEFSVLFLPFCLRSRGEEGPCWRVHRVSVRESRPEVGPLRLVLPHIVGLEAFFESRFYFFLRFPSDN